MVIRDGPRLSCKTLLSLLSLPLLSLLIAAYRYLCYLYSTSAISTYRCLSIPLLSLLCLCYLYSTSAISALPLLSLLSLPIPILSLLFLPPLPRVSIFTHIIFCCQYIHCSNRRKSVINCTFIGNKFCTYFSLHTKWTKYSSTSFSC